jgi:predicted ribosome quality control (RQC) complex YloA/Tae2 family protein
MAVGPEMVWAWSKEITSDFVGKRCTGIETGSAWTAFLFSATGGMLCSLHHGHYGCCRIEKKDLQDLRERTRKMPRFEEMLKKHVTGAKLAAAEQVGFDRILKLAFDKVLGAGFIQRSYVIFEFMAHRSNLFITGEDGRIIEVFRPIHPEDQQPRTAVAGEFYTPPPPVSARALPELLDHLSFDKPVAGFGKDLSAALKKAVEEQPRDTLKKHVSVFLGHTTEGMRFQWIEKTLTLFPVLLPGAASAEGENALDAARETVLTPLTAEEMNKLKKKILDALRKELKSTRAKLKGLETRKRQAAESWKWKRAGELLLAWQHSIPDRTQEVQLPDWETDRTEPVTIRLDPELSPVENAQSYFRLFKKKKKPAASVEKDIKRLKKQERSLRNMIAEVENTNSLASLHRLAEDFGLLQPAGKPRGRRPLPFRRFDLDGAMVLVGKNQRGNRHVTFDLAKGQDLWLHARDVPGSHVILRRLDGKESSFSPDDRRLLFAASLAAYYSKYRGAGKVLVDYTERKHVAPQKGAVADVTYSQGRSVNVSPLYWKEYFEETP